jgi:tripartite-type tricarboxylate transporter receptor subunit TctC
MLRREFLLAACASLSLPSRVGRSQSRYPSKPVRIIVTFPPGQATDIFGRMLAQQLSHNWGQQVIVENRAGGGGIPGMVAGKMAKPDGHTMIMGTSGTLSINPHLYSKLPYDPIKDFIPVSNVVISPMIFLAHPSFVPSTLDHLVRVAKSDSGKTVLAIPGQGTAQHLTAQLFMSRAGIRLELVPYKGSGPALIDLIGGQVPLMVDTVAAALPYITSKKVTPIAVTTARRVPQLPAVPTVAESGFAGFESLAWVGVLFPAGTSRGIVDQASGDIQKVLSDAKVRHTIIERGSIPDPRTPDSYSQFIRTETEKWAQVAKDAKIRVEE